MINTVLACKYIKEHRRQNSGGSQLVAGLESAVAARISRYNWN